MQTKCLLKLERNSIYHIYNIYIYVYDREVLSKNSCLFVDDDD